MAKAPKYRRVEQALITEIAEGGYRAGEMLPSEFDIADTYGVSQGTARKALIELERSGLVDRRQGKGSFVAVTTPERAHFHFFRMRSADGGPVQPKLIREKAIRRASATEDAPLGLDDKTDVVEIQRLRQITDVDMVLEQIIARGDLFPGLEDQTRPNALYAHYQRSFGIAIVRAEEAIRAVAANAEDEHFLDVVIGTPLLEVTRHAFDLKGRMVEIRRSRYRTETGHYALTLK